MPGRQSVRVTYAHKRRRVLSESRRLPSSPLEVLSPEINDLTRTQMARLKRPRRVSLAEKLEDKNVEHIREHLAKRIKRTQEHVSNGERTKLLSKVPSPDDIAFRTPFPSQAVHESTVVKPLAPEQLSPVPVTKRVMSRTSSKSLKENGVHPKALASPFSSRPSSATSSPKHKGKGRSVRGVLRSSLLAKSRTLSGAFKENTRRVSRKGSTLSLKDTNKGPARHIKHQRYPSSSPSTAYMRSQFAPEDWIALPKAFSRTFYDYEQTSSPGGSVHSNASFYADRPQSCSTPAMSRLRRLPDLLGWQSGAGNPVSSFSICKDSTEANGVDVETMDGTVHPRCRTIHLSRNSIFSSSDELTIGSLPAMNNGGTTIGRNRAIGWDEAPTRVARQTLAHREAVERPQAGHTLTEPFVAEYDILISDLPSSPASTATTKALDSGDLLKTSVGKQPFGLPGTSPAHGQNLVIRTCRNPGRPTLPTSPPNATASCPPSSPASDLVLEFQSMDICGDLVTHSDGETHCSSTFIPLQTCSHSLRDPTTKKSVKRTLARNRAGTIRASDFAKPGVSSSSVASGVTVSFPCNVRRTRSGTVVGPNSKLAAKGSGLPGRAARGAPATGLTAIQSGSDSEDELLLKGAWIEDLEYLGLAVPQSGKDTEADEMNLGGLKLGPPRRLGLRRR